MRLYVILLVLCLVSCKEISFKEPQPKGRKPLTVIPKELQGKYLTFNDDGEISKDTVVVHSKGYRFVYFEKSENAVASAFDEGALGDSLILKSYKGYYFLNSNENPEWILRVIKREKNGDLLYMAPEQEDVDFQSYLKKLSTEIHIDSMQVNNATLYQIDPTPQQLVRLIDKGYFSKTILKKVK